MAKTDLIRKAYIEGRRRSRNVSTSAFMDDIVINDFSNESVAYLQKCLSDRVDFAPNQPIVVYINSYGGSIHNMFAMVDLLNSVDSTIITVAIGKAMSAGAALLSFGDIRFATDNCSIMLHEASSGMAGNVRDMVVDAKETERINKQMLDFIAENCNMKGGGKALAKLFTNERRDVYLTPKEAKKLGLIDYIGFPKMSNEATFSIEG